MGDAEKSGHIYRDLKSIIKQFDIGFYPSVDSYYGLLKKFAEKVGGQLLPVGQTALGQPIHMVTYGQGELTSARINVVDPFQPAGMRASLVELQMCNQDQDYLRKIKRAEIAILDVDGYRLQSGIGKVPSNDPRQAMYEFVLSNEVPHRETLRDIERNFPTNPNAALYGETAAIAHLLDRFRVDSYTSRGGTSLKRGPFFKVNPDFLAAEFAALSLAAGMPLRDEKSDEPWDEMVAGSKGIAIEHRSSMRKRLSKRSPYGSREAPQKTSVVDPFLSKNPKGVLAMCKAPIFLAHGINEAPKLTTKEILEREFLFLEKAFELISFYFASRRPSSWVDPHTKIMDPFWSPTFEGSSSEERICQSASAYWTDLFGDVTFIKAMLHETENAEEVASTSFMFKHLYERPFATLLGIGLIRQALEIVDMDASFDIREQLEALIRQEVDQICDQITIKVPSDVDQILMCLGTSYIADSYAIGRSMGTDATQNFGQQSMGF